MYASVVIPVLNSSEKLANLLDYLNQQVCRFDFEVIVVDDGSTEDLKQIIDRNRRGLRLKYIKSPVNHGPAYARNKGIQEAEGQIVVFTDSDCSPQPDWLEKMLEPFENEIVSGVKGAYKTDQLDTWAQLAQLEFVERYELLESQNDIDFIDTYSGAYRRRDLLKVNGFNTGFPTADNEDVDLAFRIKKLGGRFVFVRDAIVGHLHREGWVNYAKLKYRRGFWRMKVYGDHPEKAANNSYTPMSLKLQLLLVILLPFAFLFKRARFIWKTLWLFSCFPMIRAALPERFDLALRVPVFCLVRGLALISGIIAGLYAEKDKYLQHLFQSKNPKRQDSF